MHHVKDIQKNNRKNIGEIKTQVGSIPNKHMTIWCADTNGQLGEVRENGEVNPKIIGPRRKTSMQEKEM